MRDTSKLRPHFGCFCDSAEILLHPSGCCYVKDPVHLSDFFIPEVFALARCGYTTRQWPRDAALTLVQLNGASETSPVHDVYNGYLSRVWW